MRALRTFSAFLPGLFFALLTCAALSPVFALAQEPAQEPASGRVDWTGLRVLGLAAPDTEADPRQAALSARKNLLQTLLGLRVTAEHTAGATLQGDRRASERLRALTQLSPVDLARGDAGPGRTQAVLPLPGEVLGLLLPRAAGFNTGLAPRLDAKPSAVVPSLQHVEQNLLRLKSKAPLGGRPLDEFKSQPEPHVPPAPEAADQEHTGLVVDARGLRLTPALLPVLYDEAGVGVFGAFLVSRNTVVRQGLVVYATSLDEAALAARVGASPLVVKAAGLAQDAGPDLLLGPAEAQAARSLLRARTLLARCAVAILTD